MQGSLRKTPETMGLQGLSVGEHTKGQEGGVPGEEALHAPHLTPHISSVWLFLSRIR